MLRNILSRKAATLKPTIESVVTSLDEMVTNLENLAADHAEEARAFNVQSQHMADLAAQATKKNERAKRIQERLAAIIE